MIRPAIANQQKSDTIIIPANGSVRIPFSGSFIAVLWNNSTANVLVSADDGIVSPIRAGTGFPCLQLVEDGSSYKPAVYRHVRFHNPLDVEMTVEYFLSLGDSQLPTVIGHTVRVEGDGVPTGRPAIAATVGGVPAIISADAMAVTIQPETTGLIVEVDGNVVAKIGAGDFMTFPWSNVTLTLKGDGGTSTVYLAEVQ